MCETLLCQTDARTERTERKVEIPTPYVVDLSRKHLKLVL